MMEPQFEERRKDPATVLRKQLRFSEAHWKASIPHLSDLLRHEVELMVRESGIVSGKILDVRITEDDYLSPYMESGKTVRLEVTVEGFFRPVEDCDPMGLIF